MNKQLYTFLTSWPDKAGRVFMWESVGKDNSERAIRLLEIVSAIQKLYSAPESVFLSTIEIEMEAGKYPTILAAYFEDPEWSFANRFCCERACKTGRDETVTVGHFTFEDSGGVMGRLLRGTLGLRWGSALRIGGYRVSDSVVDQLINLSIFGLDDVRAIMMQASLVWYASSNVDRLYVWSKTDDSETLERLFPKERVMSNDS